jgi:hypothetical protein
MRLPPPAGSFFDCARSPDIAIREPAVVKAPPRTEPQAPAPERAAPWKGRVLRTYGLSRLIVLGAAFVAAAGSDPGRGPWPNLPGPHVAVLRALGRWDGAWYLAMAQHGYHLRTSAWPGGRGSFAFFPLYSWLIGAGSWATHLSPLIVALVMSTVLGGVAALLIWQLTAPIFGDQVAHRAAALFCFFPGAFVLSMAYTEALTIAAAAGALLALSRRRWLLAGLLGAAAAMTRPTAAVLVLAAAWCAIEAWRRGEGLRPLWAPILTAAGTLTVVGYQWALTGHPLEWLHVETTLWRDHSGFRLQTPERVFDFVRSPHLSFGTGGLNNLVWAAGLAVAVLGVWLIIRRRLPAALAIYGIGALVFAAASFNVGDRPRPLLVAFPLVIAVAASVSGWRWRVLLVASAVGLAALSLVTFLTLSAVP